MMKLKSFKIPISMLLLLALAACHPICDCDKNLGCKIMRAKLNSNNSVIAVKIFCPETNYYSDTAVQDSSEKFYLKYATDTTSVVFIDSIYEYHSVTNLDMDELMKYEDQGYFCDCAK